MEDTFRAIFCRNLNFKNFVKIKNNFLQQKYDIKPEAETDRIRKIEVMIIEPIEIDPYE